MVEAYSHEVSSRGFWPGGGPVNEPVFYAYSYPEPQGFNEYPIQPKEAFYHTEMREFLLPYNVVRAPQIRLIRFYWLFSKAHMRCAATCAKWDRNALERQL